MADNDGMTGDAGRGKLFVISAPSGAGKTTIVKRLCEAARVVVSVSHTTRQPRRSEHPADSYFFVSEAEFKAMRAAGEFLESADVYGNLYGTSAAWVEKTLAADKDVILEIDCQGARQVKEKMPGAVLIFIAPPDIDTLRRRLTGRGEDNAETIKARLAWAESEIRQQKHFDYVIINDDLGAAVRDVRAIMAKQH